jgi:beta-N-acetylhexosaminidase
VTLEELVGSCLVFGIPGTHITPEIIQHFRETRCRGLILYRINFESPDQLRKLISDLENALGWKLLVCADHEGGRVIMFRDSITVFPSAQAIGQTGNTPYAHHQGEHEGRELRRLGIDVNFAPVLDVLTEAYSPNIGIRAFGKDPEVVAKMGAARISAMQVEGLSACAKHFPGLGPATLDPHLNLPTIAATWDDMERVHMVPFLRAMQAGVHGMMTSHPLYPKLDSTPRTPATFSRKIVHDYLRQKIGYKGVIFSDDLEMGAITELCPIGEAAARAVAAGHDVVLSCHDMKAQQQVFASLVEAYRSKRLLRKDLEENVQRVNQLQAQRTERFAPPPVTEGRAQEECQEARTLVETICHQSVSVLRAGPSLSPSARTIIVFPRLSDLASRIMIETALLDEISFFESRLKPVGLPHRVHRVAMNPTEEEIRAVRVDMESAEQTLLFVFDAHLSAGMCSLLESAQKSAKRLVVVLLRDVYDAEFVQPGVYCLTNYGFRVCDIEAVLRKIFRR